MEFSLFVYATIGRRAELEAGMAGRKPELYSRMLSELGDYVRFADERNYYSIGHPEHHLQIEGFEISGDPCLMAMWLGKHTTRMRVMTCGFVASANNPIIVAEKIATLDHMLDGRFGVGLVRGYQARWLDNFKIKPEVQAVGPWNVDTPADEMNRELFTEFVEVIYKALHNDTFSYRGKYWNFPTPGFKNPHEHAVYHKYGQGVDAQMNFSEIGIAPKPKQKEIPLYGGFSASIRTAKFWAKYKGKPIVLAQDLEFCKMLWKEWGDEAHRHGHAFEPGDEACWGGFMICAKTDAEAWKMWEDVQWFWDQWSVPFGFGMPELLVGSPETINKRLEEVKKMIPLKELQLIIPQGIHTPEQIKSSLDLFATKVMPNFR
ncbi:MAG: LLM class flavin-dependent oxidoreductase [Alphaproteobacteria bacterium]